LICTDIIDNFGNLTCLSNLWNSLALQATHSSPFLSYAWVSSYFEHSLSSCEQWFVVAAFEGEELVGILPLIACPYSFVGFSGIILRCPHDDHTFCGDLLAAPGKELKVIPYLLVAAAQYYPRFLYIQFNHVSECSPILQYQDALPRGLSFLSSPSGYGSFLPIHGHFDSYYKNLSGNFRRNLRKARNKLEKLSGVKPIFLAGPDAAMDSFVRFATVEAQSWKRDAGTAILLSTKLMAFYGCLTKRLSEADWLEWHFLEADGNTIAGHMAIRFNRTLVLWKIGYDAEYSKCAPGNILLEELIKKEYASDEIDMIDFVTDMPWHANWMVSKRSYYKVRIFQRGIKPNIYRLMDKVRYLLKTLPLARRSVEYYRDLMAKYKNA